MYQFSKIFPMTVLFFDGFHLFELGYFPKLHLFNSLARFYHFTEKDPMAKFINDCLHLSDTLVYPPPDYNTFLLQNKSKRSIRPEQGCVVICAPSVKIVVESIFTFNEIVFLFTAGNAFAAK